MNIPINIFQNREENEENGYCCVICLNDIDENDENTYTIQECSHKFHSNCLISWFRTNNSSCPTCRNDISSKRKYYENNNRFKLISNYSRRKNANTYVIKLVEKYKKQKILLKESEKNLRNFKKENKSILNNINKLREKIWKNHVKLNKIKKEIISIPIIPLFM